MGNTGGDAAAWGPLERQCPEGGAESGVLGPGSASCSSAGGRIEKWSRVFVFADLGRQAAHNPAPPPPPTPGVCLVSQGGVFALRSQLGSAQQCDRGQRALLWLPVWGQGVVRHKQETFSWFP